MTAVPRDDSFSPTDGRARWSGLGGQMMTRGTGGGGLRRSSAQGTPSREWESSSMSGCDIGGEQVEGGGGAEGEC